MGTVVTSLTAREKLLGRSQETRYFWNYPQYSPDAAQALFSLALGLEMNAASQRINNSLYYSLVTNRPAPVTMGAFMSRRAMPLTNAYSRTRYMRPHTNLVGACMSTFDNRIGTTRPFVQVEPMDGTFATRWNCRLMENFIEGIFERTGFYDLLRQTFRAMGTWGKSGIKVSAHPNKKDIMISKVLIDEILVNEEAAMVGDVPYIIQYRYVHRENLYAEFGTNDRQLSDAIATAPMAFMSRSSSMAPNDMVAVLEGWKLPDVMGNPGRHIYALPNYVLDDEPYKHDTYPMIFGEWEKESLGFYPVGLAEMLAPAQLKINRFDAGIDEQQARQRGRWLVATGSGVTEKSLSNLPGAITMYTGQKPEPITPTAVNAEIYMDKKDWILWGQTRCGLSAQQMNGEKPAGLNSGVGQRTRQQIEDGRNKSLLIELENLVCGSAKLVMRVAEEVKPQVTVTGVRGRTIRWPDIKADLGHITVYPISSLPSDPAGKAEKIEEDFANGAITSRVYYRLRQMPDGNASANLQTAADDLIEDTLDQICETQDYIAPEVYDDLPAALRMVVARYFLEKRLRAPRPTLVALQDFMFALKDLISPPAPPPPPALPAPGGAPQLGPMPGAAPFAPPAPAIPETAMQPGPSIKLPPPMAPTAGSLPGMNYGFGPDHGVPGMPGADGAGSPAPA